MGTTFRDRNMVHDKTSLEEYLDFRHLGHRVACVLFSDTKVLAKHATCIFFPNLISYPHGVTTAENNLNKNLKFYNRIITESLL
jgi:hypothetical protein